MQPTFEAHRTIRCARIADHSKWTSKTVTMSVAEPVIYGLAHGGSPVTVHRCWSKKIVQHLYFPPVLLDFLSSSSQSFWIALRPLPFCLAFPFPRASVARRWWDVVSVYWEGYSSSVSLVLFLALFAFCILALARFLIMTSAPCRVMGSGPPCPSGVSFEFPSRVANFRVSCLCFFRSFSCLGPWEFLPLTRPSLEVLPYFSSRLALEVFCTRCGGGFSLVCSVLSLLHPLTLLFCHFGIFFFSSLAFPFPRACSVVRRWWDGEDGGIFEIQLKLFCMVSSFRFSIANFFWIEMFFNPWTRFGTEASERSAPGYLIFWWCCCKTLQELRKVGCLLCN